MKNNLIKNILFIVLAISTIQIAGATEWEYETKQDKMSSRDTKFASITSENSLSLSFPYQGHNKGFLYVRQKQGKPVDIFISIMKGQIPCPGYMDGCSVTVRFDNDKATKFTATNPSDHSSDTFFIRDATRFLKRAKTANKILIQFTVYDAGEQILEFLPSATLSWGNSNSKKSK